MLRRYYCYSGNRTLTYFYEINADIYLKSSPHRHMLLRVHPVVGTLRWNARYGQGRLKNRKVDVGDSCVNS